MSLHLAFYKVEATLLPSLSDIEPLLSDMTKSTPAYALRHNHNNEAAHLRLTSSNPCRNRGPEWLIGIKLMEFGFCLDDCGKSFRAANSSGAIDE
jgi:hypothetical protein